MKIDFSQVDFISSNVDKTSSYESVSTNTISNTTGFKLDISGKVKDNAVLGCYGKDGQGMTLNQYLQENGAGDNSMPDSNDIMLRRNYMAVMSNSLSTEDFAKLQKDGYHPEKMDLSDAVNVVDQIKIKLIEAGVDIKGYTDTVDSDLIEASVGTGSYSVSISAKLKENDLPDTDDNISSVQDALDMVGTIENSSEDGRLNEKILKSLILNGQAPTINNVFLSLYQTGNYKTASTASDFNKIKDQANQIIQRAGLSDDKDSEKNAKWLYENDLPLNEDTLIALTDLKEISLPIDKNKLLDNMSDAISLGLNAKDASLVTNRRVLLEVRLSMTTEANRRLLQSDFSIDTSDMEKEVEALKSLEEQINHALDTNVENADLFDTTNRVVSQIKTLPAAVAGKFTSENPFTIKDVYVVGNSLKSDFAKASESYEALRTEIRTDLGDSIKTAFRNAADLLKEIDIEPTEANKRAVRILGYNQMEISQENVYSVRSIDQQITRLVDNLTPGKVLNLIKDGINPLKLSVSDLNDILDNYNDEDSKNQKYSEYLIKLEKNSQINPEERDAYIGIYRLIRQVEKNDGAAIGTLLNSGAELSIKNLLSSVRSRKAAGLNITVDDSFGVLEDLPIDENRIDVQISQAFDQSDFYKKETSDLLSLLNPEKLREMWKDGRLNQNTTIDDLYEEMSLPDNEYSEQINDAYLKEAATEFRNSISLNQDVEQLLSNYDLPLNAENMLAATQILLFRGQTFKNLNDLSDKIKRERNIHSFDSDSIFSRLQSLDNKESMLEAYDNLASATETMIDSEIANSAMTADEFRRMCLLNKQIVITKQMAKEENYEVPIETDSGITSVNLKVIHGTKTPEVMASMSIPDIGDLVAHMLVNDDKVSGYLMAETDEGIEYLNKIKNKLDAKLDADFIVSKKTNLHINDRIAANENKSENKIATVQLYQMAKTFIQTVNERME